MSRTKCAVPPWAARKVSHNPPNEKPYAASQQSHMDRLEKRFQLLLNGVRVMGKHKEPNLVKLKRHDKGWVTGWEE